MAIWPANDFIVALSGRIYFSIFLTFYLLLSFYLLSKKYFYSQGVFRKSTITVIIATGFAGVFSTFFGVIIPLFFGHDNPWFAACFSLPMIFILAYFVLFGDKKVYVK